MRTKSAYTSTTSFNKNPPNYCQGLSMFPVPDNKNVRNYSPLAGVGNSQQICYRARREIDKPRTTTKQSASSTMEHVRAMRERSDNVQRQRASARDAILQASLRHGAHICCSTTSVQQSSNLIKSDLGTQCSHFKRTKLTSHLQSVCQRLATSIGYCWSRC